MMSLFIYALLFEKYGTEIGLDGYLRDLKHHGTFDRQITAASKTKEPLVTTINMAVIPCFDYFPTLLCFFLCQSIFW